MTVPIRVALSDDSKCEFPVHNRPTERRVPIEAATTGGYRILVVCGKRAETFNLPAAGEVFIGRAPECEIRIDDPGLSRRHASLVVGAELLLRDLGSANGCQVGGALVRPGESAPIAPGIVIVLGGATLVVQRGHGSTRLRHIRSPQYFATRLEEECVRAEATGSEFAVARLRCASDATADTEAALARWLRPTDVVGLSAQHVYDLLVVGATRSESDRICRALTNELGSRCIAFSYCAFPGDARTPESIARWLDRGPDPAEAAASVGAMERLKPLIDRVAMGDISVLILGETGAGKEVAATAIHARSPRASGPLVSINCAAFSEQLLESELFGHERGAFTGAVRAKPGLLESAHKGTFFLDEVGEMPPLLQAKLLRVIEHRQVMRIGALRARDVDVRFLAATNRNLEREVARGAFRQDLFYRLAGTTLSIPPLRERRGEIGTLANLFVAQLCARTRRTVPSISRDALVILQAYGWPGNVRELRNVIERAVLLSTGDIITPEHLSIERSDRTPPVVVGQSSHPPPSASTLPRAMRYLPPIPMTDPVTDGSFAVIERETPLPPPPPETAETETETEAEPTADERARVIDALNRCAGNQTQAARLLGVSRRTLIKRLDAYALPRPRRPSS